MNTLVLVTTDNVLFIQPNKISHIIILVMLVPHYHISYIGTTLLIKPSNKILILVNVGDILSIQPIKILILVNVDDIQSIKILILVNDGDIQPIKILTLVNVGDIQLIKILISVNVGDIQPVKIIMSVNGESLLIRAIKILISFNTNG